MGCGGVGGIIYKVVKIVVMVVATVYGGPLGAAAASAMFTLAEGGSFKEALIAGAISGVAAFAGAQIGQMVSGAATQIGTTAATSVASSNAVIAAGGPMGWASTAAGTSVFTPAVTQAAGSAIAGTALDVGPVNAIYTPNPGEYIDAAGLSTADPFAAVNPAGGPLIDTAGRAVVTAGPGAELSFADQQAQEGLASLNDPLPDLPQGITEGIENVKSFAEPITGPIAKGAEYWNTLADQTLGDILPKFVAQQLPRTGAELLGTGARALATWTIEEALRANLEGLGPALEDEGGLPAGGFAQLTAIDRRAQIAIIFNRIVDEQDNPFLQTGQEEEIFQQAISEQSGGAKITIPGRDQEGREIFEPKRRETQRPQGFIPPTGPATTVMVPYINPTTGETWTAPSGGWTAPEGWEVEGKMLRSRQGLPTGPSPYARLSETQVPGGEGIGQDRLGSPQEIIDQEAAADKEFKQVLASGLDRRNQELGANITQEQFDASFNAPDLGQTLLANEQAARQRDYGATLNEAFPGGAFQDIDDDIISSIVDERQAGPNTAISNFQARGNLNPLGGRTATQFIESQRPQATARVGQAAQGVGAGYQQDLFDIRDRAESEIGGYELGDPLFDVAPFAEERSSLLAEQQGTFPSDIRAATTNVPLFNVNAAFNQAGTKQGLVSGTSAQAPLLDSLAAREAAAKRSDRGVSSIGSGTF